MNTTFMDNYLKSLSEKITQIVCISVTYDGHLIITFSDGIAVIDRGLNTKNASFYTFDDSECVSNSIALDENNGIYVASDSIMRKLVWTGTKISDKEADGAWSCPYTNSVEPPIIKLGKGHRVPHPNAHGIWQRQG